MSLLDCQEARALLEDATLTATTVRGCRRRLTGFLGRYLPLFYRQEQREHAELVLAGRLSHLQRKTSEPIARRAGVERKPIQTFVGCGKWDDEAVQAEIRAHVAEEFDDPQATLVLDGSAFPKKGTESCGVGRQWCGRLGKQDNCQVGVFLSCVSRGRTAPLGRRLYLPRDWAGDAARRKKCHVPKDVRFAEKWRLGLKLIEQSRNVPHGWVVADDEFGRVKEFRARLRKRRERYVLDVPCNTQIRVLEPDGSGKPAGPRRPGRPRLPSWTRMDVWAAQQPAARWQRIEIRAGEKGPLEVDALDVAVQTDAQTHERALVIRTIETNPRTHYCLSAAKPDVTKEEVVWAHADRPRVEEMFEWGNGEVGLGHYEVRSWVGWHHHITLSLLALCFLVLEKGRVGRKPGDRGSSSARNLQSTPPAAAAHRRARRGDRQRHSAA